jgi:hypothetical protein
MARVLCPGGLAVVLLPNAFGLFGNILHVLHHGEIFDDGQPLQRYATRASWERLLRDNGFVVRDVFGYERELPRTMPDLVAFLRHPQRLGRMLFGHMVPVNLSNMLIFVCTRAAATAAPN